MEYLLAFFSGTASKKSRLAELVTRMEDMGKAELTELANKGVPIFEALAEAGASEEDMRIFRAHGTRNTELAAALATLGFEPGDPPPP